ncbi:hypothetical protein ACSBOB_31275 [Mesorhizobium sp. ASY16-5R]|uniref:hypothetical protein n=1 Tax=Mesorhizobium sp. ASY16-5R TaxID=3445772 RepID=UPI003FA103B3
MEGAATMRGTLPRRLAAVNMLGGSGRLSKNTFRTLVIHRQNLTGVSNNLACALAA